MCKFLSKNDPWQKQLCTFPQKFFFPPQCHHMSSQTSWSPPPRLWLKCNRLPKLGNPVGAITLSRWEWWWNERWIWGARGALNPISTNYPDHGHHGRLPFQGKTHMVEPGIEPGTSRLVVRSSDHQATRLVVVNKYINININQHLHRWMQSVRQDIIYGVWILQTCQVW